LLQGDLFEKTVDTTKKTKCKIGVGRTMAANFKILFHKTRESLHLKLDGDFDGSSAHELINAIREQGTGFFQIFIDTNDLRTVHPFGKEVFQKNLGRFDNKIRNLIFIGENGHKIEAR
jgi:hypothetical protein